MNLLDKLVQLEKDAAEFGFQWQSIDQIMSQIHSECIEITEHLVNSERNLDALQEEVGDLLHAVFSLCVFCQFNPQLTLERSIEKFERRFNAVKSIANQKGLTHLQGLPFETLMAIWNNAKKTVG